MPQKDSQIRELTRCEVECVAGGGARQNRQRRQRRQRRSRVIKIRPPIRVIDLGEVLADMRRGAGTIFRLS